MYNKYTRDKQVREVIENQKRKMVTGYLGEDGMFETPPIIARVIQKGLADMKKGTDGGESRTTPLSQRPLSAAS